jgi:hypothetical protein
MKITIEELKKLGFVEKRQWLYLDAKIDPVEHDGIIYGKGIYFLDGVISIEGDYNTGIDLPHIDTIKKFKELYRALKGKDIDTKNDL